MCACAWQRSSSLLQPRMMRPQDPSSPPPRPYLRASLAALSCHGYCHSVCVHSHSGATPFLLVALFFLPSPAPPSLQGRPHPNLRGCPAEAGGGARGRRRWRAGRRAGGGGSGSVVCACRRRCLRVMKRSLLTQGRASLSSSAPALCVSLAHVLLLLLLFLSQICSSRSLDSGKKKKGCCCCCSHSCCKGLPFRRPLPEHNFYKRCK